MLTIEGTRRASGYLKVTDVAALDRIPVTPRGSRSERWKGVQHGVLVRAIGEAINRHGWRTTALKASVYAEGAGLVGALELEPAEVKYWRCPKCGGPLIPYLHACDCGWKATEKDRASPLDGVGVRCFGFQHRNDSKQALRCGVGALVQVCSNGLHAVRFAAQRALHTSGLDLERWIDETVRYGMSQWQELDRRVEWLRDHEVPDLNSMLMALGRRKILPWSLVGKADEECRNPRHPEFRDGSAWSWYNCVSEICKELTPAAQPRKLQAVCDLALAETNYN